MTLDFLKREEERVLYEEAKHVNETNGRRNNNYFFELLISFFTQFLKINSITRFSFPGCARVCCCSISLYLIVRTILESFLLQGYSVLRGRNPVLYCYVVKNQV